MLSHVCRKISQYTNIHIAMLNVLKLGVYYWMIHTIDLYLNADNNQPGPEKLMSM